MEVYFFFLFAIFAIAAAVAMITNKNPIISALFLVLNMVSLAVLYLLLQAQFLAVIQILVYAGAIMVLFLFVLMLLNQSEEERVFTKFNIRYFIGFLLGVVVLAQVLYSVFSWNNMLDTIPEQMTQVGTVEAVGDVLFTEFLLPFELTGVLLTAAVVGALIIAQHKVSKEND